MTNYQTYDEKILEIVKTSPRGCSKIINNDPALRQWVIDRTSIVSEHFPEILYSFLNPNKSQKCGSGNIRKFRNLTVGWNSCSSPSCVSCKQEAKEKAKATCMKKYGVESATQSDLVKDKIKSSTEVNGSIEKAVAARKAHYLKKYGVDHNWKTTQGQNKRATTIKEKYGVENPSQSEDIKAKKIATAIQNYGVEHHTKSREFKEQFTNLMIEKYGVSNPSKLPEVREKAKSTTMEKYGVEYAAQNPKFIEKAKQTLLDRYGVDVPMHSTSISEKAVQNKKTQFYRNLDTRTNGLVKPLFTVDEYSSVNCSYQWQCNKCDTQFTDTLDDGWVPKCPTCFPGVKSIGEQEVYEFIKTHYDGEIVRNSRSIISPLEIDIYLPQIKLGIEFNGIYHHSELSGNKPKTYHQNKWAQCMSRGIRLFQIYDTEWANKGSIIKSRLLGALGKNKTLFARKCKVDTISTEIKDQFLLDNHIQGPCGSLHNYGLMFNGSVVAVMTFGKSRYTDKIQYELLRYCTLQGMNIVGGPSKLLAHFERNNNSPSIISYCDLRYGTGNMYTKLGFTLSHTSDANYWYRKTNSSILESRIKYQKHKLKNFVGFDPTLTEWENMQKFNYDRIWDCGSSVFVKNVLQ